MSSEEYEDRDAILRDTPLDVPRIEAAVREILLAIGEDPDRPGLGRTPRRVAKVYAEMCGSLKDDGAKEAGDLFPEKYNEIVLVRDIPFACLCEHHLMPFSGVAHIAYIPDGGVLGLSKFARIVDVLAGRLQVQERLTNQVADLIMGRAGAKAVAVVMESVHTCMTVRGVRKPGAVTVTSALRGLFLRDPQSRGEVMALIRKSRSPMY